MSATIILDKAGRLLLPKAIRDRLHLREGSKLKLEIVGDKLEMRREVQVASIELREDGLPVIVGWEGFDAANAVREMRADHVERLTAALLK